MFAHIIDLDLGSRSRWPFIEISFEQLLLVNQKAYGYQIWYVASLSKGLQCLHMSLTLTLVQGHGDLVVQKSLKIFLSEGAIARNKKPAFI